MQAIKRKILRIQDEIIRAIITTGQKNTEAEDLPKQVENDQAKLQEGTLLGVSSIVR
jgi:hypothetical protein